MPRWWPGVKRMEAIEGEHFTQVLLTKKGRAVRIDNYLIEVRPPRAQDGEPGYLSWGQEILGTPFERFLSESTTEIALEPDPAGTLVTITQTQRPRGVSRSGGGFLMRRASRRRLDEALDGLAQIV